MQVHAGVVKKLNSEELELELQDRSTPLIIDFFATWCGPCLALAKELEQVKEELGEKVHICSATAPVSFWKNADSSRSCVSMLAREVEMKAVISNSLELHGLRAAW